MVLKWLKVVQNCLRLYKNPSIWLKTKPKAVTGLLTKTTDSEKAHKN